MICQKVIELKIPMKTVSEANLSEHWSKKHKRHKKERGILKVYLNTCNIMLPAFYIKNKTSITLTRIAPRKLDDDNLRTSFKCVRDALSDTLIPGLAPGRADAFFTWEYAQAKGEPKEYAVLIEIYIE